DRAPAHRLASLAPPQRRHPRAARDPVGVRLVAEPLRPDRVVRRRPRARARHRDPRPRRDGGNGARLAVLRHHARRPGDDAGQVGPGALRALLAPGRRRARCAVPRHRRGVRRHPRHAALDPRRGRAAEPRPAPAPVDPPAQSLRRPDQPAAGRAAASLARRRPPGRRHPARPDVHGDGHRCRHPEHRVTRGSRPVLRLARDLNRPPKHPPRAGATPPYTATTSAVEAWPPTCDLRHRHGRQGRSRLAGPFPSESHAMASDRNELVFHTNPQSRGRIVRWMLEELGQPYRTVVHGYGADMKSAEYLAIKPMGKVPAIVHGDVVVTEAAAICAYLADAFPRAGLAPAADDPLRGTYYRWMFFAAGPVEAAVSAKALG